MPLYWWSSHQPNVSSRWGWLRALATYLSDCDGSTVTRSRNLRRAEAQPRSGVASAPSSWTGHEPDLRGSLRNVQHAIDQGNNFVPCLRYFLWNLHALCSLDERREELTYSLSTWPSHETEWLEKFITNVFSAVEKGYVLKMPNKWFKTFNIVVFNLFNRANEIVFMAPPGL